MHHYERVGQSDRVHYCVQLCRLAIMHLGSSEALRENIAIDQLGANKLR